MRIDARPIDLVRIAEAALARVARLRGPRALALRHARRRMPLVADPVRIVSLVENLLDNAWKATANGGSIAIRTDLLAAASGPCVRLEIEDGGHGIAPDLGAEIFEPGVSGFREGSGLGLALCRDVVAAHGGSIEVESAPGRTLFRVELPQLRPDAETRT
jgi:signal transduction histidine kinase